MILRNGESALIAEIPCLSPDAFRDDVLRSVAAGGRISALFGAPWGEGLRFFAVLASDEEGTMKVVSAVVKEDFPSLTPECPQAHRFEREIFEQWKARPLGHPWLKPVRFPGGGVGLTDFFRLEGAEVHEVAVGPVHAGIIEPGHFRFQCHGENVYHLEISLGYQHRGIERAMVSLPAGRRLHYMETMAGDTTVGHCLAYVQALEALAGPAYPTGRAMALRAIALELERLANHTGDLGALAGDVGFLPTSSYCGRIRGDFLNMTALLCGNRFGRSFVVPGGVAFDADTVRLQELERRLLLAERDVTGAAALLWDTPSVMARFEGTGTLGGRACTDLGLVGPPARAAGLRRDVRSDFPSGMYRFSTIPISMWDSGDVFGRAFVRFLEIQNSIRFIRDQIRLLPGGDCEKPLPQPGPERLAVSLVEGWRGEICHVALTDAMGRLSHYKVTDPSFHNWAGLAHAMRGQQISDFPLCNKSFNLSYCGHDL